MAQKTISGENAFRSQRDSFGVGATSNGYTLSYSVDKETWTDFPQAVPAGENLIVNHIPVYMWFKLKGNTDTDVAVLL